MSSDCRLLLISYGHSIGVRCKAISILAENCSGLSRLWLYRSSSVSVFVRRQLGDIERVA